MEIEIVLVDEKLLNLFLGNVLVFSNNGLSTQYVLNLILKVF